MPETEMNDTTVVIIERVNTLNISIGAEGFVLETEPDAGDEKPGQESITDQIREYYRGKGRHDKHETASRNR